MMIELLHAVVAQIAMGHFSRPDDEACFAEFEFSDALASEVAPILRLALGQY